MNMIRIAILGLVSLLAPIVWAADPDSVERALSEVRDVKAALFSRESSVLGTLPGPAEMAAHQMRCRSIPKPQAGLPREIRFDEATVNRAAALDPMELRKAAGRLQLTVLPLGISGAYVTEAQNRTELLVVHVLDDAPATGVLQLDDVVIGANGRLFEDTEDPRPEMGHALVESQSPELGGILTLHVVRARKPLNVKMDLGNTLSYSDTWPFDCEKSKQIKADLTKFVMDRYPWHRYDFWTPTFLMACGDEAAMELARRHLCKDLKNEYQPSTGSSTWVGGPRLMNLCEYYLITGDSSVLPSIRYQAEGLAWGQYRSGSWTHGGGKGPGVLAPGTGGGGYGEVNCAGVGALVGLSMARQCGIEPFDHTLPRSIRFFGKFCGSNMPYGLGNPSGRSGRMDNGMNSAGAMALHLLGEREMGERWGRTVCYMWMGRERGHAEGIFSAVWGPMGAALAPKEEFHAFMNQMRWAYEMGRARDGGITFMRGSRWTYPNMAAAHGLFLCLPEHRLQILGGDSVFARRPPESLEKAASLYKDKKWTALRTLLNDYIERAEKTESVPADHLAYAEDLLAAHDRLEKHAAATLAIIKKSIDDGMLATARTQLDLLATMLGQERPRAAELRKLLGDLLGDGEPRDARRELPQPLIDVNDTIKRLELTKGGIRDGFAHSPEYIARTNRRGFQGMTPEQIARFLAHFSGGAASGAAMALAEHGEEVVPLLKRLLQDKHHGIRAGALATLTAIYGSDGKEYRIDVPEEQAEVIKLARPLIHDPSPLVRIEASKLIQSMKVLNDDVYDTLFALAKQEGSGVAGIARHGIKDPVIRTRLNMELMDTANRCRSKVPSEYIPIVIATTSHLELCEPYVQTAIDTLNNPEVLGTYGFFSNHPPTGALQILDRYAHHPLVLAHLPDFLRFSARKQSNVDSYWYAVVEHPHRIIMQIGPKALPVVDAFIASEGAYYKQIEAGRIEHPAWWKEGTPEYFANWRRQMKETAQLVRALAGEQPREDAIATICRIYLADRDFGTWERRRIRDHVTDMGADVAPTLRRTVAAQASALHGEFDKQIVAKQAELEAEPDRRKQGGIQKEIAAIETLKMNMGGRAAELQELASLMEIFPKDRATDADVRTLCRFYVTEAWGAGYSWEVPYKGFYVRALYEKQLALTRDTMLRWGKRALPTIRAFLEADKPGLTEALAQLDKDEAHWKTQWSRAAAWPLNQIPLRREDLPRLRAELDDLATIIECAGRDDLSNEQIGALCRIYTRRGWTPQAAMIEDALKRNGAGALPIIQEHLRNEQAALPAAVATVERRMSDAVKQRVRLHYHRARTVVANLRRGIEGLQSIVPTVQ